ncbi:hypothetical protein IPL44_01140 [Candidatus Saccharibacteria bacterium]|nr:MAG: hypothetical protein IPL44_01140 [Candidatus Saccharibacteria bacterium]
MVAALSKENQIEACWQELVRERLLLECDSAASKPASPRGRARQASRGKRRGRRPSHVTAPRLLVRNRAEWNRRREEVLLVEELQEVVAPPAPALPWEGREAELAMARHPAYAGSWWATCLRREAEIEAACAEALLCAARKERSGREAELLAAIAG